MRRPLLGVMLICTTSGLSATDLMVEKGGEDLLRNSALSQPFTVLDQLLLGLDQKATDAARSIRPVKNEFRPSTVLGNASSMVSYDKLAARTIVQFSINVRGIDDPWRNICASRIKDIATFGLALPYYKEWQQQQFRVTALGFFSNLLGPRLVSDQAQLTNYKAFSDSIVVILQFAVESGADARRLRFLRQCFWDNKSGQVSFREHKY